MDAETSSTTHAAASKRTEMARDAEPAEVVGMPKEPPATVASLRHKSYRHTCHRRKRTAPGRETLRPHRNSTAEQQQGHPGAKRAYRRNAPRRDTRTAADRTRSDGQRTAEATRQKTPTPSTNQPPRPRRTAPTSAGDNAARRQRPTKRSNWQRITRNRAALLFSIL